MPSNTFYSSVALLPDGGVIAGGGRTPTGAYFQGLVVKYNHQGSIVAQYMLSNGIVDVAVDCVWVLPDNSILLGISDATGDTVMQLDSTLQNIVWSRNIGLASGIQTMTVHDGAVYIATHAHIAKIIIGGDVVWAVQKHQADIGLAIDTTTGNLVVASGTPTPAGQPIPADPANRMVWVYTLSAATGEYLSGTSITLTGVTTNTKATFVSVVSASDGFIISAASGPSNPTGVTTILKVNAGLTAVEWVTQFTGWEGLVSRLAGTNAYVGGRDFGAKRLVVAEIENATGTVTYQKRLTVPSNTLDAWYFYGRDMMDATTGKIALCGWTADATTPVFVQRQSDEQGIVTTFHNSLSFTYNSSGAPTNISNSTYAVAPITATTTFASVAAEFFGISPIAAAGAP
jgi:hypothetical protein